MRVASAEASLLGYAESRAKSRGQSPSKIVYAEPQPNFMRCEASSNFASAVGTHGSCVRGAEPMVILIMPTVAIKREQNKFLELIRIYI